MVARTRSPLGPVAPDTEDDASLSGWDPYIVAIMSGDAPRSDLEISPPMPVNDTREGRLMTWLREHGVA